MTPEIAELLLDKLPELIIAVGVLVTSVASVLAAWRGGEVLKVSNGHAAKLEAKIQRLERQLEESSADRIADAVVAKQAAADVQSAMKEQARREGER